MMPDGTYRVIIRNGQPTWTRLEPRKKKQVRPLRDYWLPGAPISHDMFMSEVQRYGYNLDKMTSTMYAATHRILQWKGCIPDISLRRFYYALTATRKLPFSLRAMQGRKAESKEVKAFEATCLRIFENANPTGIQPAADISKFEQWF